MSLLVSGGRRKVYGGAGFPASGGYAGARVGHALSAFPTGLPSPLEVVQQSAAHPGDLAILDEFMFMPIDPENARLLLRMILN